MQYRSEYNTGADMKTLCLAAIGLALIIVGLSSALSKYDYCYDTAMAAKYDLPKPDFTEYSLKSTPECNP